MQAIEKMVTLAQVKAHPKCTDPQNSSEALLDEILYELGIDTSHYVDRQEMLVRDLERKWETSNSYVWIGLERRDKEWLNSGLASVEVIDSQRGGMARSIAKAKKTKELWDYTKDAAERGRKFD